jgi:hypothetical protein
MRKIVSMMAAVAGLMLFNSCTYNKEQAIPNTNTCETIPATYTGEIKALIAKNCVHSGCHDLASNSGGMTFDTSGGQIGYSRIKASIDRIRQRAIVERTMPQIGSPYNPLSQSDYNKLKCWIDRGAQND